MTVRHAITAALTLLGLTRFASAQQMLLTPASSPQDFVTAVGQSKFIFAARVLSIGATTTASLAASPRTAVVHVLGSSGVIADAPPQFRDIRDRRVTLVLAPPGGLSVGDQKLFFAHGLASDTGLVLREVARAVFDPDKPQQFAPAIAAAREQLALIPIKNEVARSQVAVIGRILAPAENPPAIPGQALLASEHRPIWRLIRIRVRSSFMSAGPVQGAELRVLVNVSNDIAYDQVPDFGVGSEFVFLLRRAATLPPSLVRGINTTGLFAVLDAAQMRPVTDSVRVRLSIP